jgi:anthranilate/para-aminobenzoate synthase component I
MSHGPRASVDLNSPGILTHPGPAGARRLDARVDPVALLQALSDRPLATLARHRGLTVVAADPDAVAHDGAVWAALEGGVAAGAAPAGAVMAGGWVAMLTYDLPTGLERAPQPRPYPEGPPRALAARFPSVALIDDDGRCTIEGSDPDAVAALAACARSAGPPAALGAARARPVATSLPQERYLAAVRAVRELICAGDCYQVNIVQRLEAPVAEGGLDLARRLWGAAGGAAHRAYMATPQGTLISASPELLVEVEGGRARTAPIKGTAPVGRWDDLRGAAKDRAEHVMIVDLMRNDLGRCARPGGVRVDELFARLRTPYVEHMVSRISAEVADGVGPVDILRAVFPGGSITGCPKLRAMEVIRALEPVARGPAFGSVATLGPGGRLEASVAIRTAWLAGRRAHYWCGGAVTWGSEPEGEWREAWAKAAPFLAAVGGDAPAGAR